jgi:cell division protein FtsL
MIKFFRKLRKNRLEEGKFSKYLVYAIGEIILVVIGILIALQINGWNETRKQENQEVLYLERLVLENKQDLSTFALSIQDLEKGNRTIEDLGRALNDPHSVDSTLMICVNEYLIYGCHYPFFNPSTSTFEDLSSTGNLGVIRDTELRDLIVSHYAAYKFTESNFLVSTNWALPIDAPFYIEHDFLKYEPTASFLYGAPESINADDIRRDKVNYIRNAAVHYWVNTDCIHLLNGLTERTSALVERLESEIKTR